MFEDYSLLHRDFGPCDGQFSVLKIFLNITSGFPQCRAVVQMSRWNAATFRYSLFLGAGLISSHQRIRIIGPNEGLPSSDCTLQISLTKWAALCNPRPQTNP